MAKEIDLTGITAGVQQANRGRRQYAEDILKDKRDAQFNQSFVKPLCKKLSLMVLKEEEKNK